MKRSPLRRTLPDAPAYASVKVPRTRKCAVKGCCERFTPRNMAHKACGPEHAAIVALHARQKAERMSDRDRREAIKTRGDHIAETQAVFNAWVRLRDADLPCICCGKSNVSNDGVGGGWDAGHYLSRGSHPHLRFDERNVFRQRKGCNRPGGTSAAAFRLGVIARIGLAAVEALEADQTPAKWSIDDLKAIKAEYRAKLKALTNSRVSG